jgi:hypothetical protein
MEEIFFNVVRSHRSWALVASWQDPNGGGIEAEAWTLDELETKVRSALRQYFSGGVVPHGLHFRFLGESVALGRA